MLARKKNPGTSEKEGCNAKEPGHFVPGSDKELRPQVLGKPEAANRKAKLLAMRS
jgi:hypothetical protein